MDKICFVIAPIGEDGSETRKRSDQILKHVIKPAAASCGYDAIRADEISEPGLITSQVIQHIVDAPLVIADLTDRNPNVFYELAIRHAIKKPLVQIIKKGEAIPFDVAGMRTIPVDHHDLDSVEEARNEIEAQIKAVEQKPPEEIETPISVSLELQQLRQSENPEQRSLADLLSVVSELRSEIDAIHKRISSPEKVLPPEYIRRLAIEITRRTSRPPKYLLIELEMLLKTLVETGGINKNSKEYKKLQDRIRHLQMMFLHEFEAPEFFLWKDENE